jgi:NAD(P)-dependent dehydrogenase (short-subunit alcohol dehydrogenase family)
MIWPPLKSPYQESKAGMSFGISISMSLALLAFTILDDRLTLSAMEKICRPCMQELRGRQPQSTIEVAEVRLSSLDSVRSFCTEFNARKLPLDFLILNAGIMGTDAIRRTTPDGFEEHFQVGFLNNPCWSARSPV